MANHSSKRFTGVDAVMPTLLDVRAVANIVLARARDRQIDVSNMAINKIVYFVHCDHLVELGTPLVGAKIEAWQHGPVFRELYQEFKRWGDAPIRGRATKVDAMTGTICEAKAELTQEDLIHIEDIVDRYLHLSAAQLRAISHIDGSPWHQVWQHEGRSNPGMKISDELILKYHSYGVRQ